MRRTAFVESGKSAFARLTSDDIGAYACAKFKAANHRSREVSEGLRLSQRAADRCERSRDDLAEWTAEGGRDAVRR